MSEKAMNRLKEALADNEAYTALRQTTKGMRRTHNFERIISEAKTLHETRTAPQLYKRPLAPIPLYEADMLDKKNRARLSTLRADLMREIALLRAAVKKVESMLLSDYSAYLDAWGNQPARRAVVDRLVSPAVDFLDEMESVRDLLDFYIKDIDQTAYSIRNSVDILKLMVERTDQIV